MIAGADDAICPPVNGHILAKLIPNSRLEVLDEGHLFVIAQPQITANLVRDVLGAEHVSTPANETRRPWHAAMHADGV